MVTNTTGSYCLLKIVTHLVSHIIFTYARNVRLRRECKRIDAVLAPLANSTFNNSVIQISPVVLAENQRGILSYYRDVVLRF